YILEYLSGAFDLSDIERVMPRNGYTDAAKVVRGSTTLCEVLWGGNTGDRVMVVGSGANASPVASLVRSEWPDHLVIRADVAEDYDEPDAFAALSALMLNIADKHRLKVTHYGDWHRCENGRTLYVGSRQSPVMVRLYEKGLEQRAKGYSQNASADWVRLEVEVKPKRAAARKHLATLQPDDFMACAAWTREVALCLFNSDLVPITGLGTIKRMSDDERALAALVKQYGGLLGRLKDEHGSWDDVGLLLGRLVEDKDST
ncbi:replication initiation factor domain-containing protein, partial [Halomonas sp. PAR7]|uniref:replication initiation factor domain-containing protein n=2 Tax=Halomonas TaxID=2745 RepID=UPI002888F2E3